jgi:predicted amidophosphoribosyltransferase
MAVSWLRRTSETGEETCCCPECASPADPKLTYCTVCGYDIVRQTKIDLSQPPHVHLA